MAQRYDKCYTGWVKTAISIPDRVFKAADKLAKRLGVSRSELYSKAVAEYLQRHAPEHIRAKLDEVYSTNDSAVDPALASAQHRSLPSGDW